MAHEHFSTVYLTKEQAARVAALAIDALVGVQLHTDDTDMSAVIVDMVPIDADTASRHFVVYTSGSHEETT